MIEVWLNDLSTCAKIQFLARYWIGLTYWIKWLNGIKISNIQTRSNRLCFKFPRCPSNFCLFVVILQSIYVIIHWLRGPILYNPIKSQMRIITRSVQDAQLVINCTGGVFSARILNWGCIYKINNTSQKGENVQMKFEIKTSCSCNHLEK